MNHRPTRPAGLATFALLAALLSALAAPACAAKSESAPPIASEAGAPAMQGSPVAAATAPAAPGAAPGGRPTGGGGKIEAPTLAAAAEAGERRIIRNADLTLEVESGSSAQQRVSALAEGAGGFIVSSDAQNMSSGGRPYVHVTVVARVPSARFGAALDEMRRVGKRVVGEKVTGQDVTEEFIDLEARLRVQRALEEQLLGLLKESKSVKDTLEVHREITQVRSEIERVEGRRRFLVNQSELSTITVRLHEPTPFLSSGDAAGFGTELGRAVRDAVEAAEAVVLFFVRALGVLLPLGLFLVLPIGLLVRRALRRQRDARAAAAAARQPAGMGPPGGMGAL